MHTHRGQGGALGATGAVGQRGSAHAVVADVHTVGIQRVQQGHQLWRGRLQPEGVVLHLVEFVWAHRRQEAKGVLPANTRVTCDGTRVCVSCKTSRTVRGGGE